MQAAAALTHLIEPLVANFRARKPLRTGSLIVTLFGDCIAPRGGEVWLGSLISALAPLGISHRPVRTAVFRLVQDGVLLNQQVGRRSYYSLTGAGRRNFTEATSRIYAPLDENWDGQWTLLLLNQLQADEKVQLRKDLAWLGFGSFGTDLLAHPRADTALTNTHLEAHPFGRRVIQMQGANAATGRPQQMLELVRQAWDLSALEHSYAEFLKLFQPVEKALRGVPLQDADAFYLRTFLIHEYRKVLLRDPALPAALLPDGWNGTRAYALTRSLYQLTAAPSERFVDHSFRNHAGSLPAADTLFSRRFGGL